MKINILTSCTGEKAVTHHRMLTMTDFQRGHDHVRRREAELHTHLRPAEEIYTGQQHVRLMEGVRAARGQGHDVQVKVLSAGYGLVDGRQPLAPYNATFNELRPPEFRDWVKTLDTARQVASYLAQPADLTLILLGDRYLDASDLMGLTRLGAKTIAFCGQGSISRFSPAIDKIAFQQADTTKFGTNMIGLKGELAKRVLTRIDEGGHWSLERIALSTATASQLITNATAQRSLFDADEELDLGMAPSGLARRRRP